MTVDGDGDKDLRELNHRLSNGMRTVKDGVMSEEEDDGLKVRGINVNVTDAHGGAVQASASLQISEQQQSQGAMVCWERFLHLRSLKVLLVENDDSTRHVVTALLRNCSYEVIEAANGLQAWKILEDLTNHIDLVLTEVVMPCFSGVGLLCKIMSHKTRKNVPVIMTSSHDSMGLVFKCLSKGAVDFLVKPIRKNELKNLWQHVWRRCHSSSGSGSGSESDTHTQKSVKSKSFEKSDNTGSNDEDDSGSIGLNVRDGSDNGSGTQRSWTKQAVEVDSPRPVSPWDQVAECPDSTCAQVVHSNAEISGNKQLPVTTAKECQKQDVNVSAFHMAKDALQFEGMKKSNLVEKGPTKFDEQIDKGRLDLNSESPSSKLKYEAANLTGVTTNITDPHMRSADFEVPNRHSKISDVENNSINDAKETPSLELSLKRLRGVKDVDTPVQDDRNVLRRSDSSAFSRYIAASNSNKTSCGHLKSVSPNDSSLDVIKKASVYDRQSGEKPNQCSNVGSNNMDMGSTTNNIFTKSAILKNKSAVTSTVKCLHPPSTFHPMKDELFCAPQKIVSELADDTTGAALLSQPRGTHQEIQARHFSHHMQRQHQSQHLPLDRDDLALKKLATSAAHCRSSNVLGGAVEGNAGNYSINGSASGSNHGSNYVSNGQNGSSPGVNAAGTNMESDNCITGKSGSGDASGSGSGRGSGNRADQNKSAQREAALTKFRQKREERCFRKKVRYQSRKRLAEQWPRVGGQFVRQAANDNTS